MTGNINCGTAPTAALCTVTVNSQNMSMRFSINNTFWLLRVQDIKSLSYCID